MNAINSQLSVMPSPTLKLRYYEEQNQANPDLPLYVINLI